MKTSRQFFSFGVRIAFVYSLLYFFVSHYEFYQDFVIWATQHLFNYQEKLFTENFGSGDRTFDYFNIATSMFTAVAAGSVWAVLDRNRDNTTAVLNWFVLYLRISLGLVMISYGVSKIYPSQFPAPSLIRLMETFGNTSPMRLLWTFMGASPVYSMFGGAAELAGGILLFLPYFWYLGALIIMGVMANVFALNVAYDVPVKSFSLSLFLAAAIVVLSRAPALFNFFVLGRAARLDLEPGYFKRRILNYSMIAVQILILCWFVRMDFLGAHYRVKPRAEVPMRGIWYVQNATGVKMFPWTHIIFDIPEVAVVKFRDGHTEYLMFKEFVENSSLVLGKKSEPWEAVFFIEHAGAEFMTFKTTWEGHPLELDLHKVDDSQFSLKSTGFHFIQERTPR